MGTTFSVSSPLSLFQPGFFYLHSLTFSRDLNYKVLHHILGSFPALDDVGEKEKGEARQEKKIKLRGKCSTPSVSGTTVD